MEKTFGTETNVCKGLRWQVDKRDEINFWKDNWVYESSLSELGFKISNLDLFEESIKINIFISNLCCWNESKLKLIIPKEIVRDICNIPLQANPISDKLFWALSSDGCYSVKSASWLAQVSQDLKSSKCDFYWIWKLNLPSKVHTFLWEICVDGLPTKEKLCRSHIFVP